MLVWYRYFTLLEDAALVSTNSVNEKQNVNTLAGEQTVHTGKNKKARFTIWDPKSSSKPGRRH